MGDAMLSQEEIDELLNGIDDDSSNKYEKQAESISKNYFNSNEYIEDVVVWLKNNIIEVEQKRESLRKYLLENNSEYSENQIKGFTDGELITIVETFIR